MAGFLDDDEMEYRNGGFTQDPDSVTEEAAYRTYSPVQEEAEDGPENIQGGGDTQSEDGEPFDFGENRYDNPNPSEETDVSVDRAPQLQEYQGEHEAPGFEETEDRSNRQPLQDPMEQEVNPDDFAGGNMYENPDRVEQEDAGNVFSAEMHNDHGLESADPGYYDPDMGLDFDNTDMDFGMEPDMGSSYQAEDDFAMYAYADPEAFGDTDMGMTKDPSEVYIDSDHMQSLQEMDDMSMYKDVGLDDPLPGKDDQEAEQDTEKPSGVLQSVSEYLESDAKEAEETGTKSRYQQAAEALADVLQSVSDAWSKSSGSKDSESYSL